MSQPNSKHILGSISRFRKLALLSAVSIMVLNVWMVTRTVSVLDGGTGAKISIAAGQMTLSQRIRSNAFEIETAIHTGDWRRLEQLLPDLQATADKFERAQRQLVGDRAPAELFPDATTIQLDTIAAIELPYQRILSDSRELMKLTRNVARRAPYVDELTLRRLSAAKDEIADAQGIFMPRMATVVDLFEQASRDEIKASIHHAKIGMLILLGVVAASILFVVEPTILIIRRQLRELDRATRHARRADAIRWRLLTNMGHEFRTPMNAIMGFAELIGDDSLSASERSRLGASIHGSSSQLAGLIETMLDLSAVESGQLRIVSEACDLPTLLKELRDRTSEQALAKGLELRIDLDPGVPRTIVADRKRLGQILSKLVENAIKFTQEGSVELLVRPAQRDRAEFIVTDTGVGIAQEHLESVFDPFNQVQDELTRRFGGAGLGLTVARDLARALGGDIDVVSKPGHGSTFTLNIPAEQREESGTLCHTAAGVDAGALREARILIVDDAKDNRVLLQHIFRRRDANIEFAFDGAQAIQSVERADRDGSPFDLILMDMQMPVLDGYSATAQLRAKGVTTPVIALTAHALAGDRQRCLDAGCDEYISKPVNRNQLLGACLALLAARSQREAAA